MTFTIEELGAALSAAKAWPKGTDPDAWAVIDGEPVCTPVLTNGLL